MIDFYSEINKHSFSLLDKEIKVLMPVFDIFQNKTGLEISEYKDIKLMPQNLSLISDILSEYKKNINIKSDIEILNNFDKNINEMILDGNRIFVIGE